MKKINKYASLFFVLWVALTLTGCGDGLKKDGSQQDAEASNGVVTPWDSDQPFDTPITKFE